MSLEEEKQENARALDAFRARVEALGVLDEAELAHLRAETEKAKAVISRRIDEATNP